MSTIRDLVQMIWEALVGLLEQPTFMTIVAIVYFILAGIGIWILWKERRG
jgi:hypothetical protein